MTKDADNGPDLFAGSVLTFLPTDKGAEIDFADCTDDEVANLMARFFTAKGFRLEEGTPGHGAYGSGNLALRLLAGGLYKRRKYDIRITKSGDGVRMTVESAMSGWSGSLLGVARERSQRKQFQADLRTYLAQGLTAQV
ncbi:MAG: hypothetical protein WBA31_01655 [Candidatus Dormiibacterota bacterium]